MTTRRSFLQGLAAGTIAAGCKGKNIDTGAELGVREEEPSPWIPEATEDRNMFPYAVRVGDVTTESAIVAIYTTETVSSIRYQLRKAESGEWVEKKDASISIVDGHGQFELTGLEANSAYSIVFFSFDNVKCSRVTRFRSALSESDWRIVSFGATSCLGGNAPWPNLSRAMEEQYDFFCLLGDTVYAHATTEEEYWTHWDQVLRIDGLYDLLSSTSVIATWDDHELTNNFNWDVMANADDYFDNALAMFRRGLPQRQDPNQPRKLWRKISHGRVLDVFVLDCRGERINEQYISTEQLEWLKTELSSSEARFKIVMNSVPISDYSNLIGDTEADDRWQGFPEQREEILHHIEAQQLEGVLWITGDFHFGSIFKVGAKGDVGHNMYEVMTGPSGSQLNPMGMLLVETDQYLMGMSEWNHTRFTCNPETGEVLVEYISDLGEIIETMTLFI